MAETPDKIQWHPAFYAAAELELKEDIEQLALISEYNLSKEPVRIDLLVIKNREEAPILKNEIGHIMRKYNVLEYKGPGDDMSIDTFYKTLGYACLYKGYGKKVNEIPAEELTVSLFREAYPKKLFWELENRGYLIEERYAGIYYVTGKLPFPMQIIVLSRLNRLAHSSLRILSAKVDTEDIKIFLKQAEQTTNLRERNNVDAVLQASVSANYEAYQEVRRDADMCEALRQLMKEELEQSITQGIEEGKAKGRAEGRAEEIVEAGYEFGLSERDILERLQKKLNISLQKAREYLQLYGKQTIAN